MLYCKSVNYPIEKLAIQFSVSNPRIATTLVSTSKSANIMKDIEYAQEQMDEGLVSKVQEIIGDQRRVSWANT